MTTRLQLSVILLTTVFLSAQAAPSAAALHSTFRPSGDGFLWNGADVVAAIGAGGRVEFRAKRTQATLLTLQFPNSAAHVAPVAENATQVPVRYYSEKSPGGVLLPQYRAIRYRGLYPGVDLIFRVTGEHIEYDFELDPHADPALIRMDYGRIRPKLTESGDIAAGPVVQKRPTVYQMDQGVRIPVDCRYLVTANGQVALALGHYDPGRPLTIDPVLAFSSSFGGQGYDAAYAMVRTASAIYIAGETDSVSLASWGRRPSRDVFVAKIDLTGTTLLYATYMGGSFNDVARGLVVDSSGNAYVAGSSNSSDFPTTAGVLQSTNKGMEDAFIVKLDAAGSRQWATLYGSSGYDTAFGIAVDSSGNSYIAGQTSAAIPTTASAPQRSFKGGTDCFIAKINSSATSFFYATLFGGSGLDACRGIAVDSSGNAYVTGLTYSSDFPVTTPYQLSLKGNADAFVAKLDSGGMVAYSTYLGGDQFDEGAAIAVDASGAAYVTGDTVSVNFPVSPGSAQTTLRGGYDAFVTKVNPAGNTLAWSTLLGGSGADASVAIAVDDAGRAIIGGFTTSLDLPLKEAVQTTLAGGTDGFAAVVDKYGSSFLLCTYLGGTNDDRIYAVAASGSDNVVSIAGTSQSSDFPKTTGTPLTTGDADVIVAELGYTTPNISGYLFVPMTPCRVVDTRASSGFGSTFGPPYLKAQATRIFPMASSNCGVPASAKAYSLNFTVMPRGAMLQYLTVWPSSDWQPVASTLNSFDGRIVTNSAIIPAGSAQGIKVFTPDDTELLMDINGYFVDPNVSSGLFFFTLSPCRVADTRGYSDVASVNSTPYLTAGSTRTFYVSQSACASSMAQVYSMNIAVAPRKGTLTAFTMWPTGQTKPGVSTLSSVNGQMVATGELVMAGANGNVNVWTNEETETFFDLNGYFAGASEGALSFIPIFPCRIIDTRDSSAIGTSDRRSITVDVLASACHIPSTARAYALNVSAWPGGYRFGSPPPSQTPLQYLSVWPTGQPFRVSTLNSPAGAVLANAAIVPAGTNGKIEVLASDKTDMWIDINGYFLP